MCHKSFLPIIEGIYRRGMFVEKINTDGFYITREMLDKMGVDPSKCTLFNKG